MTNTALQYERELRKALPCGVAARKRLLDRFRKRAAILREETPEPDYGTLQQAFGPPEEAARDLLNSLTDADRAAYRRNKTILRVVAVVLVALFLAFSAYVYFDKQKPLEIYDDYSDNGTVSTVPGYFNGED